MSNTYCLPTFFGHKVTRPSPFFEDFFENFPRLWLDRTGQEAFQPSLDVTSDEASYTIKADLPGMNKDAVNIEINHGVLTLSGEKSQEKQEKDDKRTWHLQERSFGAFSRSFSLPDDVDCEKIAATFKEGVLTITLPRKSVSCAQNITITAA